MTRIAAVRNAISSDRSHAICLLIVLAALLAATLIRLALADVAPNLTFVTYYPAVLICSLLTGWRYGLLCAVLSGVIAETLFPGSEITQLLDVASLTSLIIFMSSCAIIIATADALRRAIRDLDSANRTSQTLNHELQHRVANMITVVQALATQSAKGAKPEEFVATFNGRLQALAKAHQLLGRRELASCTLPALIEEACRPFCTDANIVKSGPACRLPSASCVPLILALHELCTNAVKYGALSTSEGRAEITWVFSDTPGRVIILWQEVGGPMVRRPTRKGLGSALLRFQSGIAEVDHDFDKAGVFCRLVVDGAEPLATGSSDLVSTAGSQIFAAT